MDKNKQEKLIGRKQSIREHKLRQAKNIIGILIIAITLRYSSTTVKISKIISTKGSEEY